MLETVKRGNDCENLAGLNKIQRGVKVGRITGQNVKVLDKF